jgi:hypothetical protein
MKYNQIKELISIIADSITILGLIWVAIYGFVKKHKSLIGFRINEFISSIFKIAIISIFGIILFQISSGIFEIVIVFTKGSTHGELWESGYGFLYILAYFISSAIGLTLFWFMSTIIWTGSFIYCKNIWDKTKVAKLIQKLADADKLIILKAEYKTSNKSFDVTDILSKMIKSNQLTITASNDLAGDPEVNVRKVLEINYRFGEEDIRKIIIPEKETKVISKE